jgi:thiamine transporter
LGAVVAISVRFIVHILSGAIFFGAWAEWFFTDVMAGGFGAAILSNFSGFSLSLIYSAVYNGSYMIPEIIITAIGAFFIAKIPQIAGERK